jgi:hypothetical protein
MDPQPVIPIIEDSGNPQLVLTKAVTITCICVGTITFLVDIFNGYIPFIAIAAVPPMVLFYGYQLVSSGAFALLAVFLVGSSIGCLRWSESSRRLLMGYATVYLIAVIIDEVVMVLGFYFEHFPNHHQYHDAAVELTKSSAINLALCIFPFFLNFYFGREKVRVLFS